MQTLLAFVGVNLSRP